MTRIRDLHQTWMEDPEYRAAYAQLAPEFELARALIEVRVQAGLTQEELARQLETSQSVVARWEGGRVRPSTRTLEKIAQVTGMRLTIRFEPH